MDAPEWLTNTKIPQLLDLLIRWYGPEGAVAIALIFLCLSASFYFYQEKKRTDEIRDIKRRCDAEIERLAEQERAWRCYFLEKIGGLSQQAAKDLVIRNKFPDGPTARAALENESHAPPKTQKRGRK